MTTEEIQQQCETLSDERLLLIVNNKRLYTEQIVRVTYQEIRKRGLSKQKIKEIEKVQARHAKIITGDIYKDILFLEKVGFFFLCIPRMHFLVFRDYRKKGFVLKVRQAWYYNLLGLVFFLSSAFLGEYLHSFLAAGTIWVTSFLLTYFLNEYYFRDRTIKYLAARTASSSSFKPTGV
jgi:hypothetical protein